MPTPINDIDIVGGKFYKEDTYTRIELHCIEYKSTNDDLKRGVGQIFWYKFAMSKLNTWVERLFLYLMVHENKASDELKEFCSAFGIGVFQINPAKIVTEVVTSKNQHGFLSREAQDKTKLKCPKCMGRKFIPKELSCPECGTSLEAEAPWFYDLFADCYGASSTNTKYQGVPDRMPTEAKETPILKKVFGNWSKVKESWKARKE